MATVSIKNKDLVRKILQFEKEQNQRDYMLLYTGFFTALRVSDLIEMKVKDVKGKQSLRIKEKKTGKYRDFDMPIKLRKELQAYCKDRADDEYLFKSRQYAPKRKSKDNKLFEEDNTPISRQRVWQIMKEIEVKFNLENIGCHTMRKTFGYHHYRVFKNLATLQRILNHRSIEETKIYIGVEQEDVNSELRAFDYD
ncbi:tyrosine-type recombinase/integrase [Cellulosilyticum sp. I15G10I2]|uniref:tyrosine-type recombinase/integrase n=1 Tax=Cellulosilyticum sp. I15G10I2 TaxID=1892843 RepID=UPI00085C8AAF|nr:tyrosine-type recombinase/integrase [Cellulosilyticum sp. I15G10I2]